MSGKRPEIPAKRHVAVLALVSALLTVGLTTNAHATMNANRNFEGEPVGQPPAGFTVQGTVLVEDVTAAGATTRAVRVEDRSTTVHTKAVLTDGAAAAKHVEFDLLVRAAATPTVVAVHGGSAPASLGTWRFLFAAESAGSTTAIVSAYDGAAWQRLAHVPGLLDPNAWQRVTVDASSTVAVLTVGGNRYRTTAQAAPSTSVTGVEFASAGTQPAGSTVYVDNLVLSAMTPDDARLSGVAPVVPAGQVVRGQPTPERQVATFDATTPLPAEVDAGTGWTPARVASAGAGRYTVHAAFTMNETGTRPLRVRVTTASGVATVTTGWYTVDPYSVVLTDPVGTAIRFPDVIKLADGRLYAAYHSAAAHANANGTIYTTTSRDGGRTWTEPKFIFGGDYDNRDPKLLQLRDGTILLTFFQTEWVGGVGVNRGVYIMRWVPRDRGFAGPYRVDSPHSPAYNHGPAVELPDGDVLLPMYGGGARVARSHDGGRNFSPSEEVFVVQDTSVRAYHEPNITRLPSGELVMGIRTQDLTTNTPAPTVVTRSFDGGRTWSPLAQSGYKTSSHHQLLTSDGRLLLTYGLIGPTGARPTYGSMITDPAGPWTGAPAFPLYDAGTGFDQANPSTVEVSPGHYLTLGFDVLDRTLVAAFSTDADYGQPAVSS